MQENPSGRGNVRSRAETATRRWRIASASPRFDGLSTPSLNGTRGPQRALGSRSDTRLMRVIVRAVAVLWARLDYILVVTGAKIARRSVGWQKTEETLDRRIQGQSGPKGQRQFVCSQPQPISITCDFSASLQYSLQNLLPSSGGQSHAPCAHLPVVSSVMRANLLLSLRVLQLLGDAVNLC